ncbi:MAG: hypothetical protein V1798_00180 [Pseudomonadota bacterium]
MSHHFKLQYSGSKFWLIFWAIFLFPVAFVLLAMRGRFESPDRTVHVEYPGSVFWLAFWALVFFPVAVVLLVLNGITFVKEDLPTEPGPKPAA